MNASHPPSQSHSKSAVSLPRAHAVSIGSIIPPSFVLPVLHILFLSLCSFQNCVPGGTSGMHIPLSSFGFSALLP